jgi:hypothetical protein
MHAGQEGDNVDIVLADAASVVFFVKSPDFLGQNGEKRPGSGVCRGSA